MKVLQAVRAVQADLAKQGIAKEKKNAQQGFMFRGIDQIYQSLSPSMVQHELTVVPTVLSRVETVRQTKNGGLMYNVVIECRFTMYGSDGSSIEAVTVGEGMDTADKATAKAASVAYKIWALQTFCIPLQGEPDADYDSHPESTPVGHQEPTHIDVDKLYGQLEHAAHQGMQMLQVAWQGLSADERKAVGPRNLAQLKGVAK